MVLIVYIHTEINQENTYLQINKECHDLFNTFQLWVFHDVYCDKFPYKLTNKKFTAENKFFMYTISCGYVITCNKTEWCVWNLFWTYALCNFICSFVWCKTSWNFSILRLNIYRRSPEFLLFDIMLVDMTLNMKNIYIFAKHFVCRTAYLLY